MGEQGRKHGTCGAHQLLCRHHWDVGLLYTRERMVSLGVVVLNFLTFSEGVGVVGFNFLTLANGDG